MTGGSPPVQTDGRRLRTETSRARIVDALIELVRDGQPAPSAEAVADRAGVGLRTVFRLFSDMDALYREMQGVMLQRLAPLYDQPLGDGDWRDRLDRLVDRRTRIFEEILPLKAAADAHRVRSPFLQSEHEQITRLQRKMLKRALPTMAGEQAGLLEALDLAMSFESWKRLRHEQGLDPDVATAVVRRVVDALLWEIPPR